MVNVNRLKDLRKKLGRTQSEVAQHVGISQNSYSYWENGKVKIDNESLKKLADYFNVSIDYLLGREDKPTFEEQASGVTDTLRVSVTAEEDNLLVLYREIGRKKGADRQRLFMQMGRLILELE